MRPIATDVARSSVFVSVCWSHGCAVQKGLNRSRCRLRGWLMWTEWTIYYMYMGVEIQRGKGQFWGLYVPSKGIESLLQRMHFTLAVHSRLRPIGRIARAQKFAWHAEWSCLLHGVIGNWMIPVAANATAMAAAKIAYAFEWPGQPQNIAPSPLGSASRLIHGSVVPPEPSSKTACRSV